MANSALAPELSAIVEEMAVRDARYASTIGVLGPQNFGKALASRIGRKLQPSERTTAYNTYQRRLREIFSADNA